MRKAGASQPTFARYIGIDYSGAKTPSASLPGLRVYLAEGERGAVEVGPPLGAKRYWTREGVAEWVAERLAEEEPAIVGIDHAFSFPLQYFEKHGLRRDWDSFLEDFQRHWPTDADIYVDFVREGREGDGAARAGSSRWKRVTERRAGSAKSVFHFDVPGSVAKSTHAGLPWLLRLRRRFGARVHLCHPRLCRTRPCPAGLSGDQHDALSVAEFLRDADRDGRLGGLLQPALSASDRAAASVEGWILGVV
jgi:hypothetical protein